MLYASMASGCCTVTVRSDAVDSAIFAVKLLEACEVALVLWLPALDSLLELGLATSGTDIYGNATRELQCIVSMVVDCVEVEQIYANLTLRNGLEKDAIARVCLERVCVQYCAVPNRRERVEAGTSVMGQRAMLFCRIFPRWPVEL